MSGVGCDELEVALAKRHERVASAQPIMGPANCRSDTRRFLEPVDAGGKVGDGVNKVIDDGHAR